MIWLPFNLPNLFAQQNALYVENFVGKGLVKMG